MKYLYVDYLGHSHFMKENKAKKNIAERGAVICFETDTIIHIADAASPYACEMLPNGE